ncbi:HAD family hydrolase [Actinocrinis puniceicyclus]|uniref:HAD family hydrolase n=1 Tax=Actinocrinis puniceicyclus TaxID=977794 RepID=A0A8J8BEK7_9ACTN|nr:HAD family hydrolase [Actinocrinis puniceicyclus]MBS2965271.1 HAD family hydrolase [Actinocrinis puniceicyclus]
MDERETAGAASDGTRVGAVLFDVDGTLVDTAFLHTVAWWQAFRQADRTVAMARIHRAIGMGSDHLLEHLLGPDRDKDADGELSSAHDALFAAHWPNLRPLDGADHLLRACHRRGWRVVLASSAKDAQLSAMRAALDAEAEIDAVTGADDVQSSKPAPDLVQRALERAGVAAHEAVFVGDTRWDVEAAARAGVPCVGMLSGGWSRAELEQAGAVEVYEDPAELLGKLDASILSRPPSPQRA